MCLVDVLRHSLGATRRDRVAWLGPQTLGWNNAGFADRADSADLLPGLGAGVEFSFTTGVLFRTGLLFRTGFLFKTGFLFGTNFLFRNQSLVRSCCSSAEHARPGTMAGHHAPHGGFRKGSAESAGSARSASFQPRVCGASIGARTSRHPPSDPRDETGTGGILDRGCLPFR